ncbi:MAG: FecR domain-containing protein [Cyanobacteria bacterium P01_C01_bin.73]
MAPNRQIPFYLRNASRHRMGWIAKFGYRLGFGLALGLLMASLWVQGAGAQVSRATITEILDGNQVYVQNRQAQVNSVARLQQQVRTARSRAELRFNTGAIARLAQNSRLTVGNCAQLQRGTVLVNGAMNGCTRSTVAGVRGTLYTLTVDEDGQETIRVFEGEVAISARSDAPEPDDFELEDLESQEFESTEFESTESLKSIKSPTRALNQSQGSLSNLGLSGNIGLKQSDEAESQPVDLTAAPVLLAAGQQLTVTDGDSGVLTTLTAEDFAELIAGALLQGYSQDIPGMDALRRSFNQLFPSVPFPSIPGIPNPVPSVPLPFPF